MTGIDGVHNVEVSVLYIRYMSHFCHALLLVMVHVYDCIRF